MWGPPIAWIVGQGQEKTQTENSRREGVLLTWVFTTYPIIWDSNLLILLSTAIVIRLPICGNKFSWLLNLNLTMKTLRIGIEIGWPVNFHAGKTQLVSFECSKL